MTEEWEARLEEMQRQALEGHGLNGHTRPATPRQDSRALDDARLSQTIASRALEGRYVWSRGLGWLRYAAGHWTDTTDEHLVETVRRDLIAQHAQEAEAGADTERLKRLSGCLAAGRITALVRLCRGILEVDATDFDQHPDLLNAGNGVVDLRTGALLPHDPGYLFTKRTPVHYRPGAVSPDWTQALEALPGAVAEWLQVRVGQAATGHPTSDDVLPVLQGGGSNGKTTVTGAIARALGDHAVTVPERVLLANPSDHPTELMTLRGARFALIEETPEARHLNVKRLKDTVGTPTMTARHIRANNVTWTTTHSLFLTSNYRPRVDETDHGTWRRLALVRFPYRYAKPGEALTGPLDRAGAPGLRERLRDGRQGQHEAILAWIVAGAMRWYARDRVMPQTPAVVDADTLDWRSESDLVCGYITDRLVFDTGRHVMATDLLSDFNDWTGEHGHRPWSDQTLAGRFGTHSMTEAAGVEKRKTSYNSDRLSRPREVLSSPLAAPVKPRYWAWHGVRYRTAEDDITEAREAME